MFLPALDSASVITVMPAATATIRQAQSSTRTAQPTIIQMRLLEVLSIVIHK
jgi:hypothetical protein